MTREELKIGTIVRYKTYPNTYVIDNVCEMKMPDGEWVDGVVYIGRNKVTHEPMVFVREISSFLRSFSICNNLS